MDNDNFPITFEFDLVDGHSQLIIGLDAAQFSDTCNRSNPRTFSIKRPQDKRLYTLHTYTAQDENQSNRLRIQVIPHRHSPLRTLIANTETHRELTMTKRIHRFGHARADEMVRLIKPMNYDHNTVRKACEKVHNACPICTGHGQTDGQK